MVTKYIKILTLLVLSLSFFSCDDEQKKVTMPSVLLSETQMVDVMTDVYTLEQSINYRRGRNIKVTNLKTKGYDALFSHYGITDSIFIKNLDYYNDNPEMMKNILDSVNARFVRKQEELKSD